jgi:hypothetical protein
MSKQEKPKGKQVQVRIEADEATKAGAYCNSTVVTHTAEEFIADFLMVMPQPPYGKLNARILMSPGHAKRFARVLQNNLARYEQQFGRIKDTPVPQVEPGQVH